MEKFAIGISIEAALSNSHSKLTTSETIIQGLIATVKNLGRYKVAVSNDQKYHAKLSCLTASINHCVPSHRQQRQNPDMISIHVPA